MRVLLAALALMGQSGGAVTFVGSFHDLRFTDDHAYGTVLELWRDDGRLIGRWSRAEGPPADFPTVPLQTVTFEVATGRLAFTISWCGQRQRFDGVLAGRIVSGRLFDGVGGEVARVRLVRDEDDDRERVPHVRWEREWQEVVERRRPRCAA